MTTIVKSGRVTLRRKNKKPSISRTVIRVMKNSGMMPEVKTFDYFGTGQSVTQLGTVGANVTFGVQTGTADYQRVGEKIQVVGFAFKWYIINNTTTATNELVNVYAFIDHQVNGVALSQAVSSPNTTGINPFISNGATAPFGGILMKNTQARDRYRHLYQKSVSISGDGAWNGTVDISLAKYHHGEFFKKFKKPIQITYNGSTNAIADVVTNAFYVGASGINSASQSTFVYMTRLYYRDN